MKRVVLIRDQHSKILGHRILNSQLSVYLGLLQLSVCLWSLAQHVFSLITFNKILHCDFSANSTLPPMLASVDAIIFDVGLFHSLWGIHGCVAQHLDGGYGRFVWCVTHISALCFCLPFAFVARPRPHYLWPLLVQSAYGVGLLILSLAALPRVLPTLMGELSNAPIHAIFFYLCGTFMNFFLLYIYWHWYWYVEAQWDSARKLRNDQLQQSHNRRTGAIVSGGGNGGENTPWRSAVTTANDTSATTIGGGAASPQAILAICAAPMTGHHNHHLRVAAEKGTGNALPQMDTLPQLKTAHIRRCSSGRVVADAAVTAQNHIRGANDVIPRDHAPADDDTNASNGVHDAATSSSVRNKRENGGGATATEAENCDILPVKQVVDKIPHRRQPMHIADDYGSSASLNSSVLFPTSRPMTNSGNAPSSRAVARQHARQSRNVKENAIGPPARMATSASLMMMGGVDGGGNSLYNSCGDAYSSDASSVLSHHSAAYMVAEKSKKMPASATVSAPLRRQSWRNRNHRNFVTAFLTPSASTSSCAAAATVAAASVDSTETASPAPIGDIGSVVPIPPPRVRHLRGAEEALHHTSPNGGLTASGGSPSSSTSDRNNNDDNKTIAVIVPRRGRRVPTTADAVLAQRSVDGGDDGSAYNRKAVSPHAVARRTHTADGHFYFATLADGGVGTTTRLQSTSACGTADTRGYPPQKITVAQLYKGYNNYGHIPIMENTVVTSCMPATSAATAAVVPRRRVVGAPPPTVGRTTEAPRALSGFRYDCGIDDGRLQYSSLPQGTFADASAQSSAAMAATQARPSSDEGRGRCFSPQPVAARRDVPTALEKRIHSSPMIRVPRLSYGAAAPDYRPASSSGVPLHPAAYQTAINDAMAHLQYLQERRCRRSSSGSGSGSGSSSSVQQRYLPRQQFGCRHDSMAEDEVDEEEEDEEEEDEDDLTIRATATYGQNAVGYRHHYCSGGGLSGQTAARPHLPLDGGRYCGSNNSIFQQQQQRHPPFHNIHSDYYCGGAASGNGRVGAATIQRNRSHDISSPAYCAARPSEGFSRPQQYDRSGYRRRTTPQLLHSYSTVT